MNSTKPISIIVAIAENYAIGLGNKLLWHIPDDLKRFKQLTSDHTVVMGKNTYNSLPKRPLPNRKNIVITDIDEVIEGCTMAYSIVDAIEKMDNDKENFIIGGGSIYKQLLPFAQKLYITKVHKEFEADTFFPHFELSKWKLVDSQAMQTEANNSFSFSYEIYQRI